MKPLTNETKKAWERELQVWDNEVDAIMLNAFKCVKHGKTLEVNMTPIRTFIDSLLQAKEREMVQEIEKWMNDEIIDGYGRALVIDVEQWKKLKSKLSNLSK